MHRCKVGSLNIPKFSLNNSLKCYVNVAQLLVFIKLFSMFIRGEEYGSVLGRAKKTQVSNAQGNTRKDASV